MAKSKILIVEDDAIIVFKLRRTLEMLGYHVAATADTGAKAIEYAFRELPDLILMDIRLKGAMDGIQAMEQIRSRLEVPVIFMTAYSDEDKIRRAKQTLPYGYLLKPVQDKELEINIEIALYVARVEAEKRLADEERKKLQQQLFQAQKMESLGTLAGGIAHDFNNLLFQIMGSIQIAKKKLPETDRSVSNLANALQAAYRAKDLVQQILTFSRKSQSDHKPLPIQPIAKEALRLLRSSLPTTIQINQEIDSEAGVIECDPTQVYQVLINLCTNAYHSMAEKGGALSVSIRENSEHSTLDLTVDDTGCGMEPAVLEKIFDPYFTTKGTGEGTGLGLSIVHGIVSKHNGRITVASTPGVGSTFTVSFPLAQSSANNQPALKQLSDLPTGNESVLVVDDEDLIMKMETEILESLGYSVTGFSNSTDALEAYQKEPAHFDLILTDQTMPRLTGIELSKRILALNAKARIILLTGFSENVTEKQVLELGVKRFLMKPLDLTKLATTVRDVLEES
jgi:signal transduction histidine kinase